MDYAEAVKLVTADQNESVFEGEEPFTEETAVAHVRNTISLEGGVLGAVALVDYGDRLTEAYRIVLTAEL